MKSIYKKEKIFLPFSFLFLGFFLSFLFFFESKERGLREEKESFKELDLALQEEKEKETVILKKQKKKKRLVSSRFHKKRPFKRLSDEKLDSYFTEVKGEYSYSNSLFAYPQHMFSRDQYKDQIIHETNSFFFVSPEQRPEEAYQVVKDERGDLAIFTKAVVLLAKGLSQVDEVKEFLSYEGLSEGSHYNYVKPGYFFVISDDVKMALEFLEKIKRKKKEGSLKKTEVFLDLKSRFPKIN